MDEIKKIKLLIVEDEVILALTESVMLKKNGYDVLTVSSGEQAIETVKNSNDIDLVLIDLNLGSGINGAETSRRILEIKDLPIIFLTSYTSKEIVDQVKTITRYGYVIKGSGEYILLSSIEMALALFLSVKKIESSEANFHQLTAGINEVFWLRDIINDAVLYVSPAYEKIWGRSCESFYHDPFSFVDVVHPDDRRSVKNTHEDIKLNHLPLEYEYRIVRDDGEVRWIRSKINTVADKTGKVFRYAGIAEDVTERKYSEQELQKKNFELVVLNEELQATLEELEIANQELLLTNKSLHESELKFRTLTEASPVAIMIYQENFWVYTNPIGVEISGYTEEELFRMRFWEFVDPEFQPLVRQKALQRQLNNDIIASYEFSIITKNGVRKWVSLKGNSIIFRGKPAAMISVIDITDRKITEDDLIETNKQLEAALERAHDFAIAAEAANIAKSQFLANMSHEIRTPMNGIIGIISLLCETDLTEEQKKYTGIMQKSGDSLLVNINQILDLSKIESHKFELEKHNFNLQTAMYDIVELFAVKARKKNLDFNFRIDDEVPCSLNGDSVRLRQVIINLSHNAIKFTEEGKVEIEVKMIDDGETSVKLKFNVSDTGVGIQEDHIKDLFVPFTQVDGGLTRKYGGTGLGLAISKKIVELMGGEIGVTANGNCGSLFWFTVVLDKQNKLQSSVEVIEPHKTVYAARGSGEILIVEDNKTNQFVANSILQKLGYKTDLAVNGFECIEALKVKEYSAVFMDCQMPDMDGFQATEKIRNGSAGVINPDTLIIALTAHAMNGDREKCINAGMNDYISKPVKMKDLDDLLKKWLSPDNSNAGKNRSTK